MSPPFRRSGASNSQAEMIPMQAKESGTTGTTPARLALPNLPDRALIAVFKRCAPADVWALRQTCKSIRRVAQSDETVWTDSFRYFLASRGIHESSFPHEGLSSSAMGTVRFNSMISGEIAPKWDTRSLPTGPDAQICGVALIPGGRWLITRSAITLQCWDLGPGVAPQMKTRAVAEFDLNPATDANTSTKCSEGAGTRSYRIPLLLDQTTDSNTRIFVPNAANNVTNSHVVSCDLSEGSPRFHLLSSLRSAEIPPFPEVSAFKGSLVAAETETNITIWNWEEDKWITFTEDNFFDQPPCPKHTDFQLHLLGKHLIVVTGGELKVYVIPELRPRRPRVKPAFLAIRPLYSVRLYLAFDANPVIGRISEDNWSASLASPRPRVLTLCLIYPSEILLFRLPPLPTTVAGELPELNAPSLLNRRKLEAISADNITLVGGASPQTAWNIFPRGDCLWVMTGSVGPREVRSSSPSLTRRLSQDSQFRALCKVPYSGGTSPQVSVCPVSGRMVMLNSSKDPITIFDLIGRKA